jgi:hypothetical protein
MQRRRRRSDTYQYHPSLIIRTHQCSSISTTSTTGQYYPVVAAAATATLNWDCNHEEGLLVSTVDWGVIPTSTIHHSSSAHSSSTSTTSTSQNYCNDPPVAVASSSSRSNLELRLLWIDIISVLILLIQNSILVLLVCFLFLVVTPGLVRTTKTKKSVLGLYQHHLILQEQAFLTCDCELWVMLWFTSTSAGPSHAEDAEMQM